MFSISLTDFKPIMCQKMHERKYVYGTNYTFFIFGLDKSVVGGMLKYI